MKTFLFLYSNRAQEMADSMAQRDALLSKILSQMSMETADLMSTSLQVKDQDRVKESKKMQQDDDGMAIHFQVKHNIQMANG